jgi:hypothetical protein
MDVLPMLYDAADIPLPRTRRQNLHLYEKSLFPNLNEKLNSSCGLSQ